MPLSNFDQSGKSPFPNLAFSLLAHHSSCLLCLDTLCVGPAPLAFLSPPYVTFYVAIRGGVKRDSIELDLSASSESARATDKTSKMAAPSKSPWAL